jgi:hypothetical protein
MGKTNKIKIPKDCLDITILSIISILGIPFVFFLLIYSFLQKKYNYILVAIILLIGNIFLITEMYRICRKKFPNIIHLREKKTKVFFSKLSYI